MTLIEEIRETAHIDLTEDDVRLEIAIALYQQEKITLGTGAKLAKMNQFRFQQLLGSRGIGPHYDVEDFEQDLKTLKAKNWI